MGIRRPALFRYRLKGFASRGFVVLPCSAMIVHLIDGTYELFRHFYGLRRFTKGKDRPYGAVVGVLQTVLQMMTPHSPMLISGVWFEFD
jgi:hypothetical protein